MKSLSKIGLAIVTAAMLASSPMRAWALDDFWNEDDFINTVQAPSATQLGEDSQNYYTTDTYTQSAEVSTATENRKIKDIQILGTNTVDPAIVMQKMNLQKGGEYSRDLLQMDLKAIYQLGFFTDSMKAIPIPNEDGTVSIKIMLQENAPITDFTVEGNTVVTTEEIMNILMPMRGKPQNIGELNEAIAQIQDLYTSKGYVLSRVDSVNDDPDGTVNITIKEGIVDKIMITGNEKTKDFVIERNILTEPGSVYNENILKEDLVRLYATQAFKDVTREIEPSLDVEDAYDITIKVEEQRTASISVGGGIDSVTGVFGSLGISDNNFRGMNQRLSLNGLAGTGVILNDASIKRRMNLQVELSFYEPHFLNADTSLMSKIFYRDFGSYQVPLAIERRIGGEVTLAHRFEKSRNFTSSLSLGVENISVKEGDYDKIFSLYNQSHVPISERAKQLEGGLFLSLSPSLIYDTRNSATVTRKGTLANLRFDEEFGLNGFDKTHGKLTGMVKQYIPVGKKSSLSFTAKGGGKIHGDNMPEVMAYRLGGPYTVRGYKMSGIGTGDAFIMGSAEFATPIPFLDRTKISFLNNLRFTMWADAGKVFNGTVTNVVYDRPEYGISVGVGLKVYVPGMGPLSIDYGIPLTHTGRNGSDCGYFTFGVGDIIY